MKKYYLAASCLLGILSLTSVYGAQEEKRDAWRQEEVIQEKKRADWRQEQAIQAKKREEWRREALRQENLRWERNHRR